MSLGLQLILSTSLVASPAACSWAHPGANPYRGDPVRALSDFDLSATTRTKLRALMSAHRYTDVATITRDDIAGNHGYVDLREMHSGHGKVCHGEVDRSAWSATHRERALVYCADDACVLVPTICNNVSLVSRKPDRPAALDDSPIDISPAAGPAAPPADAATTPTDTTPLLDFSPMPDAGGGTFAPSTDAGDYAGGPPGQAYPGMPIVGGGGSDCCGSGPVGPIVPIGPETPPGIASPVPEPPVALLLVAALLSLRFLPGRRGRGSPKVR